MDTLTSQVSDADVPALHQALVDRLKSGRWDEAMALRPPRHRAYQRQAA